MKQTTQKRRYETPQMETTAVEAENLLAAVSDRLINISDWEEWEEEE